MGQHSWSGQCQEFLSKLEKYLLEDLQQGGNYESIKSSEISSIEQDTAGLICRVPRAAHKRNLREWEQGATFPSLLWDLGFFPHRVSQEMLCTISKLCTITLSPYSEH